MIRASAAARRAGPIAFAHGLTSGGHGNVSFANANDGGSAANIAVWQAQLLDGDFADGGPIIRTVGSAASVGPSSSLAVAVPNGAYTAWFTFDDGSEQLLPVTVEDGLFRHPVCGALERGVVRKTVVAAPA